MTVKCKRTDCKPTQVLEFDTEIDFRRWYKKTMRASNNKAKVKMIRERMPSLKGLDTRQLKFLGNGGDKSFCIHSPRFMRKH